jgi:hypothetical protein
MIKPVHDCDETCRGCATCYRRTGDTICARICACAQALPYKVQWTEQGSDVEYSQRFGTPEEMDTFVDNLPAEGVTFTVFVKSNGDWAEIGGGD